MARKRGTYNIQHFGEAICQMGRGRGQEADGGGGGGGNAGRTRKMRNSARNGRMFRNRGIAAVASPIMPQILHLVLGVHVRERVQDTHVYPQAASAYTHTHMNR